LMLSCRIATGLFEGASYPTIHNLASKWFLPSERSRCVLMIWGGAYLGTVVGLVIAPPISDVLGWQFVFYIFGSAGFFWFIFWQIFGASRPADSRWITAYEKEYIMGSLGQLGDKGRESFASIPWIRLLSNTAVWAIIVNHFANNWGFYILLTWLPKYLSDALHFDLNNSGFIGQVPFLVLFFVVIFAGRSADLLIARGVPLVKVRKLFQCLGLLCPALGLGILCIPGLSTVTALVVLILAVGLSGLATAGYGVNHLDISPRYAGILFGFSNTIATIPGIVGVSATGVILEKYDWSVVWLIAVAVYVAGAIFYIIFAKAEKVFD